MDENNVCIFSNENTSFSCIINQYIADENTFFSTKRSRKYCAILAMTFDVIAAHKDKMEFNYDEFYLVYDITNCICDESVSN